MAEQTNRIFALDALRGLAALFVVLFHYIPYYDALYGHSFTSPDFLSFGRYGVHLFFILSGFVIFMTLERTQSAAKFALARAVRLLPTLWVSIFITFTVVSLIGPNDRQVDFLTALLNLTLLHSFIDEPHVDGVYWSLVIEATFYVLIALMFYQLKTWQTLRRLFWGWTLLSYFAISAELWLPQATHFVLYELLFTHYAPLFISGILIYRWHTGHTTQISDVILLSLTISHALFAYPSPFNLFVIATYAVFILAVAGYLNSLVNGPMLLLGKLSYALYLVHQNIGYGIIDWSYQQGFHGLFGVALAVCIALLFAAAIHYSVERPALNWYKSHRYRKKTQPLLNAKIS